MRYESRRGRIVPPDLDDRTWQDLVDQMRALIPTYAPGWTDQSPSDLGITLLELFAWLGEQIIYRLNQTPERSYLAFLDLLGITRDPPTPAQTFLTFTTGVGPVVVPAGSQAQTASREGQPVTFETDEEVLVQPTTLATALSVGPCAAGATTAAYDGVSGPLVGPPASTYLLDVPAGQSILLCLGFDKPLSEEVVLDVRLYRPVAAGESAAVAWSYSKDTVEPLGWPPVPTVTDGTEALNHDGRVRLQVPADWTAQRAGGAVADKPWTTVTPRAPRDTETDPLFWLGMRLTNPGAAALAVGVDRLLFNAASARTALTIQSADEVGTSTGQPFQVFELRHRPLYRRTGLDAPYEHLVVEVGTGTPPTWQEWQLVDDLPPGQGTGYRLNPVTGEITFGNHEPASGRGHGSIPPAGTRIRARTYRYVDRGAAGNVDADRVTVLAKGPTGVDLNVLGISAVTNLGAAREGADEEPIEETLRRAPDELKIRDRAVTAEDYEFLAGEAGEDVRTRRCLTPRLHTADGPGPAPLPWRRGDPWSFAGIVRAPGNVTVIVVPDQGNAVPRPEPTPEQLRRVRAYLERRRDLTAHLEVLGPRYLPVVVSVDMVVWQQAVDAGADLGRVRQDTLDRIALFLHPTRGGPDGGGWDVGEPVFSSDLFKAIMPPEDLGYVSALLVRPDVPAYHFPPLNPGGTAGNYDAARERPIPLSGLGASVRLADYELVCAAPAAAHQIKTTVAAL